MKVVLAIALGCSSVAASAQMLNVLNPVSIPYISTTSAGWFGYGDAAVETPTMRRQKLERAIALRGEADALLRQDGGSLTPEHAAYVRRKACDILGVRRNVVGSIVPQNRCGV